MPYTSWNPWADTTTVDELLTWLEAECPVSSAIDALSKKTLTNDEYTRLIGDLQSIANDAILAMAVFKQKKEERE